MLINNTLNNYGVFKTELETHQVFNSSLQILHTPLKTKDERN